MKVQHLSVLPMATILLAIGAATALPAHAQKPKESVYESFETVKSGEFSELQTALGQWRAESGSTVVKPGYFKSGNQCLQLTGGEKTSVVLDVNVAVDDRTELSFWAERWTARTPFLFRIEKNAGNGWQEIYNGDGKVRVGRAFLNHVKIPLADPQLKQLRFTCSSPPNTGVMLDDIRIAPAKPQKIESVEMVPFTLPALVGAKASPLFKLRIETSGSVNPVSVVGVEARVVGTDVLDSLSIRHDSGDSVGITFPEKVNRFLPWTFSPIELHEGENIVWLEGQLAADTSIDGQIGMACRAVKFSNGERVTTGIRATRQRKGVALRTGGDDGVNTYRIPGLATTKEGTLIGVYDVRRCSGGDLPGDIDVGMSRSTDGGQTWEPMRIIMDMGDDPEWHYDGIGDPAVLVDEGTGTIWVAATWSHGNRSWRGSGPGLTPEETGQLMLVRSDDDGETWSKPINITEQVKRPEWCFILQGPGKGITMRDGTIVFAAQYQDPPEQNRLPHSTIIYSKDHGKTWEAGTGAFDDTTESQVVEIERGVLMLNCRYNRKSTRVVMVTRDMGKTWQKHPTSERALIEPRACMGSLIDIDREVDSIEGVTQSLSNSKWLLFSNPNSLSGRNHITIKASPDNGSTWPKQHRLLLDEHGSAGYSCMSMIDDKTVGILYEGSQSHMTFQRIPLRDGLEIGDKLGIRLPQPFRKRLQLPNVFSDHMVLQANSVLPVFGTALKGQRIFVTLGEEMREAVADQDGKWRVDFSPRDYSTDPIELRVKAGLELRVIKDILIGEVWVCAGQSNMEWMLQQSTNWKTELANASHPHLRLLHLAGNARGLPGSYSVEDLERLSPENYCRGQWEVATEETARSFSAVGWYFGRSLQQHLDVPVGLICPAVGGSPTEAWISREALEKDPELNGLVAGNWLDNDLLSEFCRSRGEQNLLVPMQAGEYIPTDELGPNHPFKPGFMWDAGIEPLIPFAIRGVIWYQGESNAERAMRVGQHERIFVQMIESWRKHWEQGDFPFLYVQLPAIDRPHWPEFRDSQRRILQQVPNSGMAITIDTGEKTDVHPALKKPVGERLARWALGTTYRKESHADYSGPLFESMDIQGNTLKLSFAHTYDGLKSADGQPLRHFEVCGADGVFHPAVAQIGSDNTILISSEQVAEPKHARYAWVPFPSPEVNLVNSAGLPASPFTTE